MCRVVRAHPTNTRLASWYPSLSCQSPSSHAGPCCFVPPKADLVTSPCLMPTLLTVARGALQAPAGLCPHSDSDLLIILPSIHSTGLCPGGFTAEFCQIFKEFIPNLHKLFQTMKEEKTLPNSVYELRGHRVRQRCSCLSSVVTNSTGWGLEPGHLPLTVLEAGHLSQGSVVRTLFLACR